jgi:hypothetical protein
MTVSFKRAFVLLVLALVLLAGLFSWTMKLVTSPAPHLQRAPHTIAWTCPPPPFQCWD